MIDGQLRKVRLGIMHYNDLMTIGQKWFRLTHHVIVMNLTPADLDE